MLCLLIGVDPFAERDKRDAEGSQFVEQHDWVLQVATEAVETRAQPMLLLQIYDRQLGQGPR